MSILQEYEENEKILDMGRIKAIDDYINYCKNNGVDILYSDIVYKQKEYEMFDKWFESNIKPFVIVNHTDKYYSLILDQVYFDRNNFNKEENNLSYQDIANFLKVSKSTAYKYYTGQYAITIDILVLLAELIKYNIVSVKSFVVKS